MNKPLYDERDIGAFIPSNLDDFGLDPFSWRIYTRIVRRAGTRDGCFESIDNMAFHCKMNRKTVFKSLKLLIQHGLIRKESIQGKTSRYHITHSSEWIPLDQPIPNQVHPTHPKSGTPPVPNKEHDPSQIRYTPCTVTGTQRVSNQGNQIKEKKEGKDRDNFSFFSNPEQANPETNEPDPTPTISSLSVQNPNLETELEIQTDAETKPKVIADAEEKETPLPPFAVALTTETNEVVKSKDRVDPRFDKKIPFSGKFHNSSFRNELKYFRPVLEGGIFGIESIKADMGEVKGKTLLCMLNEKGIDPIANLENFLDYYYKEHLNGLGIYKNHSFSPDMVKVKTLASIMDKIVEDKTGVLIQAIADFKKKLESKNKPSSARNKAFDDIPDKPVAFKTPEIITLMREKKNSLKQKRQQSIDIDPNLSTKVG